MKGRNFWTRAKQQYTYGCKEERRKRRISSESCKQRNETDRKRKKQIDRDLPFRCLRAQRWGKVNLRKPCMVSEEGLPKVRSGRTEEKTISDSKRDSEVFSGPRKKKWTATSVAATDPCDRPTERSWGNWEYKKKSFPGLEEEEGEAKARAVWKAEKKTRGKIMEKTPAQKGKWGADRKIKRQRWL